MKMQLVAALALCAAAFGWPIDSANAMNLAVNGDFEGGIEPGPNGRDAPVAWQWFGIPEAGNTVTLSADTPSGTGNSADLDIQEALGLPWLIQDVDISTVPTGTTLTLTASVKELRQFTPEFDAWIASQVYLLPSSESGSILASGFAFYTSPNWQTQSFDIVKPDGANVARILFTPQNPSFGVGTGRYLVDNVMLTVPSASAPGDANGDGSVDLLDLDILGANFGTMGGATVSTGDFNADGNVDLLDLDILGANFGGSGGALAVPEPAATASVAIVVVCLCASRGRVNDVS